MPPQLVVETVVSQLFEENSYLLHLEGHRECLVIDPGFDSQQIHNHLTANNLELNAIINTHGHSDHIAGNDLLKRKWPRCPIIIGELDAEKLLDAHQNLSAQFGASITSPPADQLVVQGDQIEAAGLVLDVLEAPGHTRGHVVYVWKGQSPWIVFSGDVLFQGSIGRSDFPDGDLATLLESIRTQLFALPDDTIVLSGHGEPTTIEAEKQFNPFVRQ